MSQDKDHEFLKRAKIIGLVVLGLLLIYVIAKSYSKGNDINVYLHAASQIVSGEDPYVENPFNNYLYSPLFAVLMAPLAAMDMSLARVFWALFNCFLLYRSWSIFAEVVRLKQRLSPRLRVYSVAILSLLAFNAFNHNLILGQLTVLMIWMLIESLYRINRNQWILGACILALGINVKIIPLFALGFLLLDFKLKPLLFTLLMLGVYMLIPAIVLGWDNNMALHAHWFEVINPFKSKFGLEVNDGCVSLNCLWSRTSAAPELIKILTNVSRLLVIGLFAYYMRYSRNVKAELDTWRSWSLIFLAILLFFPHQMKYTMLFILPAAGYALMRLWEREKSKRWNLPMIVLAVCFIIPAIIGRDIIGNLATDFFDTIGMMGLLVIIAYAILCTEKSPEGLSDASPELS